MTRRTWWVLATAIVALALAASANSLANGFAYDDLYVLEKDPRTKSLSAWWTEFAKTYWAPQWGGDGYRPLTRLLFRLEWVLGGGSPALFHAVNVVLHVVGSVVVFWLACALLPLGAAWIAAALFAVHPVHVEVIANVIGQSELVVSLFVTLGVGLYVHGRRAGPITRRRWLAIAAVYAAACFFKEHAIVLPALILLAEATVVPDRAPLRQRLARLRLPLLVLLVIAVGYIWARSSVVRGFGGFGVVASFRTLQLSATDRILTMIGAAPEWLRLLLWPARLMTDYAPPYIDIAEGPSITQLPGLLVLLGTLGLMAACWRRSPVTSFGIGWIVLTLLPASNFIIPAGIVLAERTLFLPSVGAMIALASALPWLYARLEHKPIAQYGAAAALLLLLALGIGRSVTRNRVWKDNDTLLRQGIADSPRNYRMHYLMGAYLFEIQRKVEGERHYREALRLFPYDPILVYGLAEQYRRAEMCGPAIPLYEWAFTIEPRFRSGEIGLAWCYLTTYRLDEAYASTLSSIRWGARYPLAREMLRAIQSVRDTLDARRAGGDTTLVAIPAPPSPAPPDSAR